MVANFHRRTCVPSAECSFCRTASELVTRSPFGRHDRSASSSASAQLDLRRGVQATSRISGVAMSGAPPEPQDWRSRLRALMTDVFVVEDPDYVRDEASSDASSTTLPSSSNASGSAFAWGGDGGEEEEALRLPTGIAAAERLAAQRGPDAGFEKIQQPALRDDQIRDARKDPAAVLAVFVIIAFQAVGSLIGLTRDVLPQELQGAAVMEEPMARADEPRDLGGVKMPADVEVSRAEARTLAANTRHRGLHAAARTARRMADPQCCAPADGGPPEGDEALLLSAWRLVRAVAPPLVTGASGTDGDDDPAGALFNALFIRLPFLAGVAAIAANVALGGGVSLVGLVEWPPNAATPDDWLKLAGR